jgi:hypothetical protein
MDSRIPRREMNVPLPTDADGRTYITDMMLAEEPEVAASFKRTRNSWYRDKRAMRWVLYPTVGRG